MKQLSLLVALLVLGSVTVATAADFTAFSDVPVGTEASPAVQGPTLPPWTSMLTLTFWNDAGLFGAAFPGLTMEDFSATNVPANSVEACDGPFNAATNNLCFSPGDIVAGLEVDNLAAPPNNLNVVLTPPFLSVTSVAVGPNTFDADAVIRFTPAVAAVGMDVISPFGPFPVTVNVFGAAGLARLHLGDHGTDRRLLGCQQRHRSDHPPRVLGRHWQWRALLQHPLRSGWCHPGRVRDLGPDQEHVRVASFDSSTRSQQARSRR